MLGEEDEQLALRFARPAADKFAGVGVRLEHGVPLLERAIARFTCDVAERIPGGDHSIFTGLTVTASTCPAGVHFCTSPADSVASNRSTTRLGAASSYGR